MHGCDPSLLVAFPSYYMILSPNVHPFMHPSLVGYGATVEASSQNSPLYRLCRISFHSTGNIRKTFRVAETHSFRPLPSRAHVSYIVTAPRPATTLCVSQSSILYRY